METRQDSENQKFLITSRRIHLENEIGTDILCSAIQSYAFQTEHGHEFKQSDNPDNRGNYK